MAVKRKKVDLSLEKQILTGMIMCDRFLRDIQTLYHPDLLEISYGPIIARWCLRHYQQYEKAPGALIEDIFHQWAKTEKNEEEVKYIQDFLATLSDDYEHAEKFNADYVMDRTVLHWEGRSYRLLAEDLLDSVDHGDIEAARERHAKFKKVEKLTSSGVDVFDDEAAWERAFENNAEELFSVPGELGRMLNSQLTRESFIALMGVAKIGKTWNLNFLKHCAIRARCNVALFQAGDMTEGQQIVRDGIFITQRSNKPKYCGEMLIPTLDCEHNQKDTCPFPKRRTCKFGIWDGDELLDFDEAKGYVPCTECQGERKSPFKGAVWYTKRRPVRPLKWREAFAAAQEYKKRTRARRYKLETYPANTLTVATIEAQLEAWERLEGWIPDVVIIDYADILAPAKGSNKTEPRHNSNQIWMDLSSLRQKWHCCVITATQANGMAIGQKTVGREHYAEDRRKYDHATAFIGLSQTPEEKRKGITRWGYILVREDDWDVEYQVNVIGCLQIGRPYLDSF